MRAEYYHTSLNNKYVIITMIISSDGADSMKSTIKKREDICDEDERIIISSICAIRSLTSLRINGLNGSLIDLPQIGLLSLTELNLSNNSLGLSTNWDWLESKQLMNSLRKLDLSYNGLNIFPPQLVKYEKLKFLNLERNRITYLPFGIRRMRALRSFFLARNNLVSLPSTYYQMTLHEGNMYGNSFMYRKKHHLLCIASCTTNEPKSINCLRNDVAPLWLQAARVVSKEKLAFSYETLPANLVDLLLELPKCPCGKLCYKSKVYERAIRATDDRTIFMDVVLCGKFCEGVLGIMKDCLRD